MLRAAITMDHRLVETPRLETDLRSIQWNTTRPMAVLAHRDHPFMVEALEIFLVQLNLRTDTVVLLGMDLQVQEKQDRNQTEKRVPEMVPITVDEQQSRFTLEKSVIRRMIVQPPILAILKSSLPLETVTQRRAMQRDGLLHYDEQQSRFTLEKSVIRRMIIQPHILAMLKSSLRLETVT